MEKKLESLFLEKEEISLKEVDDLLKKEASTLKARIQKANNNNIKNGKVFLDISGKIDRLVSLIDENNSYKDIIKEEKSPKDVVRNTNGYKELHKVCADINAKIELASNTEIKLAGDVYDFTDEKEYKGKYSKFIIINPNKPYNESSDAHIFSKNVAPKNSLQLNS